VTTTWLITREADDARAEREARGVDSIVVPCVETKLLAWPWISLSPAGQRVGERVRTLTFFTSRRSISAWIAAGKPALEEVAALKPATSTMLEAEGLTPAITSEGGVVSLAEAVLAWAKGPLTIHYPTSDLGLKSPEQARALELLQKAGTVDRRVVYQVTAPANLRQSLERSARGDWAISFASPSAVQHFFGSGAVLEQAPVRVACLGASTERAWNSARPAGWPQAVNTREAPHHPEVAS
jgi:uroporphyrinogen-III synthase